MLILDLDCLDSISETIPMHLQGGRKAQATSAWFVVASGQSTFVAANSKNQASVGKNSAFASSRVEAIAIGEEDTFAGAFSFSSASS